MKYWKETLFFSAILAYFLFGLSPDMTWMSIGADQLNYVVAALHNAPAGLSGNPLYILLGSLFVRLPGNDFWNLGLLSALPAIGTCIVIYFTVKHFTASKIAPYIASLVFASSFSVWVESVIAETYMITAFVSSLVIYFCLTKHYIRMAVMMALGVGLHPLGIWVIVPCMIYSWWIEGRKPRFALMIMGIAACGFIFRLRDVFTEPATSNLFFLQNPYQNLLHSAGGYFGNSVIPIGPTLQRIWEDFVVFGSSLWAFIIAAVVFVKRRENVLLWIIFGLAVFFPFASIYPQWIKYMWLPMLPLSILVGLGLDKIRVKYFAIPAIAACICFMTMNVAYYSPGKTIDVQPTTARQFYDSLDTIPDDAIVVGHTWGHPDLVILYYSVNTHDRFDYINFNAVANSPTEESGYIKYQENKGIVMPVIRTYKENGITKVDTTVDEFSKELQQLNSGREVLVTYVKDSEIPMAFALIPASDYYPGINDLPSSKVQFSG